MSILFLNKIYTDKEIEYCESKGRAKYEHYAARFAVKEAAFKAVSEEVKDKYSISWKDIETLNDENGRPRTEILFLSNKDKMSKFSGNSESIDYINNYLETLETNLKEQNLDFKKEEL